MAKLVEKLVPGRSECVQRMREQLLDFSSSLTARTLLLRGPIGAGKSTVARVIALLKRVAPLKEGEATRILELVPYDGHNRVDLKYLPWFVELTITGLVEGLADVQLFGARKGAYTGATSERAGVFELASTARSGRGREPESARLTGGVVFLDEIGDLPQSLQAKLLPVLSGGAFYQVGGEGDTEHELRFRGTILTASWRRLDAGLLRPDLLSRLSAFTLDIPGLADRMDDFDELLNEVEASILASIRASIDAVERAGPQIDLAFWRSRKQAVTGLESAARVALRSVDWSRHGNLRGLSAAVEQIITTGRSYESVLDELPLVLADPPGSAQGGLLSRLLEVARPGDGLAGQVKTVEVQLRDEFRAQLIADAPTRRRLARKMGLTEQQFAAQMRGLPRRRLKMGGEKE